MCVGASPLSHLVYAFFFLCTRKEEERTKRKDTAETINEEIIGQKQMNTFCRQEGKAKERTREQEQESNKES